jgi:uncharacterized protein
MNPSEPSTENPTLQDRPEAHRFEATIGGRVVGFVDYQPAGDLVAFTHTQVDRALEGRGIAGKLVRFTLEEMRARGVGIVPVCPFYVTFLKRHPEFVDLVPADRRPEYGL